MAKTFLNLLKPKVKVGRSSFDLSQKHVFSSLPGQVVPVCALDVVPNDYLEIDIASLTRTQTFNTAAMVRGTMTYEVYAVPYSNIWHNFNQFITQRQDKHSTAFKGITNVPVCKLEDLLDFCWFYQGSGNTGSDIFGMYRYKNALKLLDMLGYGDYSIILNLDASNYASYKLQIGAAGKYVNLFKLAAYQHICYDRFRNKFFDTYETGNPNLSVYNKDGYNVDAFNYDDIDCSTFANSIVDFTSGSQQQARLSRLLSMRYAPWKMDYFTSALPSTQFGAVSSIDLNNFNLYATGSGFYADQRYGVEVNTKNVGLRDSTDAWVSGSESFRIPNAFDVLQFRKAELLQRWKQNTLRAGNMVDDQFRAHFGVTPTDEDDNNVRFLGSFESQLQVNPVEATAVASSGVNKQVGNLAGIGTIVVQGNKVKFTSDDRFYGVVMVVCYFRPEAEYKSNGLDRSNTLYEQFDFYTSEFANVGLVPVLNSEYDFTCPDAAGVTLNGILGYAPPFSYLKTAVDKVHAGFYPTEYTAADSSVKTQYAPFAAWVAPRREKAVVRQGGLTQRSIASFYVDPSVYNNVFGIAASLIDTFINNVYVDIKAIRPMTELGLPQF